MHSCLCVDEILRLVFRCTEGRQTLCALARTCRAFNVPATDLIWETLEAVEPILQNLSSAKIMTDTCNNRQYLTLGALSDNDWNTVRRLSSRVRRFHTFFNAVPLDHGYVMGVPEWFRFLASPQHASYLFPNFRALSLEVSTSLDMGRIDATEFKPFLVFCSLLVGWHLSALRSDIPRIYSYLGISSIPGLYPNVRMLSIERSCSDQTGVEKIPGGDVFPCSSAVSELPRLEIVRCYVNTWELLGSLAQLNALRQLWMYLPNGLGLMPESPTNNLFPQLRTLVTEITLSTVSGDDFNISRTLTEVSSLILSRCKHLEFLWILSAVPADGGDFNDDDDNDDEIVPAWPRPMLELYQAFPHLRVIALMAPRNLTLADSDLEDMVKSWPHLEVFHLFPYLGRVCPTVRLTLRGVSTLLYHCRKLKHFTLPFDATHVPVPKDLGNRLSVPNTAVRYMGVHGSPVSESSNVAAYISTIMPNLEIVGVGHYEPGWHWICNQHQRKPVLRTDMSPEGLYSLITIGTVFDCDWDQMGDREWHLPESRWGRRQKEM
ncbi:hypothetical protein BKA82DRAFT_4449771 [Pisolithus tinctorius]|nr:hypothetical protein BKA82DRAFT_4449771 [Pisolithus tinctorius]